MNWSTRTLFINGHDGGGAALLRVMTDGYQRANGLPTSTAVIDLGSDGIDYPIDTTVRVLCVKADATGAKVAMRALSGESRLVVVAAQVDGIFHPKVPYAARYTFRQLAVMCPVRFMPYEIGWRSDLAARPGRRYQQAVARMVTVIEQTRNSAGGVNPQPVSKTRRARKWQQHSR